MKKRTPQLTYCMMQCLNVGLLTIINFSHAYMLRQFTWLSNTAMSMVMAAVNLLALTLQASLAAISAKKNLPILRILAGLCMGIAVASGALLFSTGAFGITVGAFMLLAICIQAMPAFVNGVGMEKIQRGYAINYGVARGLGSATYSVVMLLLGNTLAGGQSWTLPLVGVVLAAVFLGVAILFTRSTGGMSQGPAPRKTGAKDKGFFKKFPWMLPFLGGCVCLFLSHNLLTNYMYQIELSKGGGEAEQGILISLTGILELPAMFGFTWLAKKWPGEKWLRLCPVFFAIRALGMLAAPSFGFDVAAQFAHMLGFGIYVVASTYFVAQAVGPEHVVQGQSVLAAASPLSSVLAMLLGGPVLDHFGARAIMMLSAGFAAMGFILFQIFVRPRSAAAEPVGAC